LVVAVVVVETVAAFRQQVAEVAAALVGSRIKQPERVRPVRALMVEVRERMHRRTVARVVVVQARRVQMAMLQQETAERELHISQHHMAAAAAAALVALALLALVALVAVVRVVALSQGLELMALQTQAAAAAEQEPHHQELALVARVAKALSL
jgi:hypothetical protein